MTRAGRDSRAARGVVVGSYASYGEAQRAVDGLSDAKFPVEHVRIVGRDGSACRPTRRLRGSAAVRAALGWL